MNPQKTWWQIIRWKLVASILAGSVLFVGSGQLGFPRIYQFLFVGYAVLGFIVFVVLDAPPMKTLTGWKAGAGIVVFYLACSVLYVTVGSLLPQFDPQFEKDGIVRKTARFRQDVAKEEALLAKVRKLANRADEILTRLAQLEALGQRVDIGSIEVASLEIPPSVDLSSLDVVERGKLVYQDYECYNCHKIGGRGGKKRGPKLDNIGNLATAEQLKEKIFNPKAWYAEGFEKRKKDKMPDKFVDIMGDEDLEFLVAYMLSLKDTAVDTPKPVFP